MALLTQSGIYKIINTRNQKCYVGCATNIKGRINSHLHDLRRNKHANNYLQRAWNKYGEDAFVFEILECCSKEIMYAREHYWVATLTLLDRNIGYNIKPTDPNKKSIHSEETRKKLSNANKGKTPSVLCIQKRKEIPMTEEHKEILRKSRKHIDYGKLHREKRGKKIINIITGEIYNSLAELSDLINIPKYELSRRLLGKRINNTQYIYAP